MIVCIFEHVQWRWALNDRLALGYRRRRHVRRLLDALDDVVLLELPDRHLALRNASADVMFGRWLPSANVANRLHTTGLNAGAFDYRPRARRRTRRAEGGRTALFAMSMNGSTSVARLIR